MRFTKVIKNFFLSPMVLSCLIVGQVANGQIDDSLTDSQKSSPVAAALDSGTGCPRGQICTGNVVLVGMQTDMSSWNRYVIKTSVVVANDASDLSKGYRRVHTGGADFQGFYYRVKPGKTYYFKATYLTMDKSEGRRVRFTESFYYKSRGDALNPGGSGDEGPILPAEAKAMGLPSIPKCRSVLSPAQFCTNLVVHIFWDNDLGHGKRVLDIDLYVDNQHVKHGHGSHYRGGGQFKDFFYVLPHSKYVGIPVSFMVRWRILEQEESCASYFENSQTLENRYTPGWAFACKSYDSWEKCQYRWEDLQ
ncbi:MULTISPECIES: hypothetical protein [unclassified Endozoicomonas]|uniref:hypothetical protein n=1 Tax=unclassified Endozoicomonas TaxID=2644528 RepID=UPI002148AE89|nr:MULTISPECIES: hypothetical protein [unclassified Endozoicomonas]